MQFPIARGFKACQWKCSNELRKNIARFSFFIFENTSLHARSFHELKGTFHIEKVLPLMKYAFV
jgi:hypothetical protein